MKVSATTLQKIFRPGQLWTDLDGKPINAHGGGIVFYEGRYYWYGEHKLPGLSEKDFPDAGVHVYSSEDLFNWKDEGLAFSVDENRPVDDPVPGCILERPKVLFNEKTKTFVMFFKFYPKGTGYEKGYIGVATSATPLGPFGYRHKFLGLGSTFGSGDFAMVPLASGGALHLSVRKPDRPFCAGRLTEDFLFSDNSVEILESIPAHTEAPAVFEHEGVFYLIGSGSTGWDPNAARSFRSKSLTGPYEDLGNPCRGINPHNGLDAGLTFGAQISFVLPVPGKAGCFIAMFDIWKPERASDGLYVWLPIFFEKGRPIIEWRNEWDLKLFDQPSLVW